MSKFDQFVEDLGKKVHDLSADDLKIGLSDVAPSASNTVWANITEITPGNGYTAGGSSLSITSYSQTAGLAILIVADLVFTATADRPTASGHSATSCSTTTRRHRRSHLSSHGGTTAAR